ncbi:MAG: hypothetical protein HQL84_11985 [Magnetococcales bacterium]|nr:hypothetical protein [Magnetococcales bacterium]MBF0150753.1 hypothetical protein [Magnetococcales bacterium]
MPITIYYGPPGAYKTSSALLDFFADAAFSGRTVMTNIRGLDDRARVVSVLEKRFEAKGFGPWRTQVKKVPDHWQLIYRQSEDSNGIKEWQTFFHDLPRGALIIIDEAQRIYRKELTAKQLSEFDYPGGPDRASEADVPADVRTAFEMHRHWNLDFVLTCQNLSQLHELIKNTSEMAHSHQNLASVLPFMKGHYVVRTHPADTYLAEKNIVLQRNRVIQKWIFDLYKSTATGIVSDTNTGTSLWRNPAIAIPVVGLVLCVIYFLFFAKIPFLGKDHTAGVKDTDKAPGNSGSVPVSKDRNAVDKGNVQNTDGPGVGLSFFETGHVKNKIFLVGLIGGKARFEVETDDEMVGLVYDQDVIERIGYKVEIFTNCLAKLTKGGVDEYVRCKGIEGEKKNRGIL